MNLWLINRANKSERNVNRLDARTWSPGPSLSYDQNIANIPQTPITTDISKTCTLEYLKWSSWRKPSPHHWCLKTSTFCYNEFYEGSLALYSYFFWSPFNRWPFQKHFSFVGCQDHDSACTYHYSYQITLVPFSNHISEHTLHLCFVNVMCA